MRRTVSVFVTLVVCVVTLAGAALAADDKWSVELGPLLWAVNIDGSVAAEGQSADFSANFSDMIKDVNFGVEFMLLATHEHLAIFGQTDYFSLSDDFINAPGGDYNANVLLGVAAMGYRFEGFTPGSTMGILGGLRYLRISNKLDVNGVGRFDKTNDATDAIAMLRSSFPVPGISKKLAFNLAASVGAGGSKYVWELQPMVQYQFNETLTGRLGFRRLQYKLEKGDVDVDMGFQGFIVGLGFTL